MIRNIGQNLLLQIMLTFILLCITKPALAATVDFSGEVVITEQAQGDKIAVGGAMVTITDSRGVAVTTYSAENGRWQLKQDALIPPLTLRARTGAAYADTLLNIEPGVQSDIVLALNRLTDAKLISERLTASAHAASVNWQDDGTKQDFISQCHFCHQIGNASTRVEKTEQQWRQTLTRMQGYGALITWQNETDFAKTLSANFNGKPVTAVRTLEMHDGLAGSVMREWAFGGPINYVHDIDISAADGLIYGVDMSADKIWILDRTSNNIDSVQWPANDLPLGGMFSGAVAPLGTFAAHHGPHSIVEGPNGKMYTTNSLASEIGIFDPKTRATEFIKLGGDTVYPHTLRFDQKGMLWFTLALSNQIGRLNPVNNNVEIIDLPSNGVWRWVSDAMLPNLLKVASWFGKKDMQVTLSHHQVTGEGREVLNLPYGIDVNPIDGMIWYSKLYAGRIGKVDPKTLEVTEFATPYPAPRRLRFAQDGTLWIPSFESGRLMKFDTKTERFVNSYKLPLLAEGEYETPYAVAVEPSTQHVWIAANMSDRILRFNPKTERFSAYPSPTRVTFLRDFIFTPNGDVCTSNANLPAAAIEDGRAKFMCLTPAAIE